MSNHMELLRTTVASEADAERLLSLALDAGAACVHQHRIESSYHWQGKLERASEIVLEARVLPERLEGVWEAWLTQHPYDTPMIECIPGVRVNAKYLAWARNLPLRELDADVVRESN